MSLNKVKLPSDAEASVYLLLFPRGVRKVLLLKSFIICLKFPSGSPSDSFEIMQNDTKWSNAQRLNTTDTVVMETNSMKDFYQYGTSYSFQGTNFHITKMLKVRRM
jgi:hypothetical protein